jgi:hypothetical protein
MVFFHRSILGMALRSIKFFDMYTTRYVRARSQHLRPQNYMLSSVNDVNDYTP